MRVTGDVRRHPVATQIHRAAEISAPLLAGTTLGIWGSLVAASYLTVDELLPAIASLGDKNLLLLASVVVLAMSELAHRGRRQRDLYHSNELAASAARRQVSLQHAAMETFTTFVESTLGVACNARYFRTVFEDNEHRLYQVREQLVEHVPMPAEHGFSYVPVTDPRIVMCEAFRLRAPIFSVLPSSHQEWYGDELGAKIDARQRWVLACPVLSIDPATNLHLSETPPVGVLVMYGTKVPRTSKDSIERSKHLCQRLADLFAHIEHGFAPGRDVQ